MKFLKSIWVQRAWLVAGLGIILLVSQVHSAPRGLTANSREITAWLHDAAAAAAVLAAAGLLALAGRITARHEGLHYARPKPEPVPVPEPPPRKADKPATAPYRQGQVPVPAVIREPGKDEL